MTDNLSNYIEPTDSIPETTGTDVDDILSSLSDQEKQEIERLEEKLEDVRQQLAEEREVLDENIDVIYRQIEEVQDQLRELDTPGHKPDKDIQKERELRQRLEVLYGDIRRERREWRRDRQKPLEEKRELEELLKEFEDSVSLDDLV